MQTTSIKPSGTVSLLAGASPGMHFPEGQYYIRRVRIRKGHEVSKLLCRRILVFNTTLQQLYFFGPFFTLISFHDAAGSNS